MITRGRPQTSASTVPAHNVMSEAPALWHAALAWSSSAGWALIGPGGSIIFATEAAVDDFSEVESSRLAVFDGPELHPRTTSDTATRPAVTRRERDVLCLLPPS
jgi:hypothetical protein